jgi:hypothetical protein
MIYWLVAAVMLVLLMVGAVRVLEPRIAFFPVVGEDVTPGDLGVAFESVTIGSEDGERLCVWSLPHPDAKATVIYFHGNGGNLSVWAPILVGIQQRGYSVNAVDYRGYGASTGTPSERGLYRDVDAVVRWATQQPRRGIPFVYWGRSLGATMAAYGATVAKPDGLILEAGFPDVRSVVRGSPALAFLARFSSYRFPTASFISRARVPVLVMHGDADSVIPFAVGRELFASIPDPKRFLTIRGGDHNDREPRGPDAYWSAVDSFVESLHRAR